MVDDFDCNAPAFGLGERERDWSLCKVFHTSALIFGFERGFKRIIGVVSPQNTPAAQKAFFVCVVGINKPTSNAVWSVILRTSPVAG